MGIAVPKWIMGSDSDNHGINRVNALHSFLGNLEGEELLMLIQNKKSMFNHRADLVFEKIDDDKNGYLELDEM